MYNYIYVLQACRKLIRNVYTIILEKSEIIENL